MPRYKLTVEYDGTSYSGWQAQKNKTSIQDAIELAVYKFSQEEINIYGSGRTDAGVHAYKQVIHLDLKKKFSEVTIVRAINFYLKPNPIVILSCEEVDVNFHARFHAIKRYYIYKIVNRPSPLAIDINRAWHVPENLDMDIMKISVKKLEGTHDFSSFRNSLCQAKSPIRHIDFISIDLSGDRIIFRLSAQSFLHNMVRNIVGAIVAVGKGEWSLKDLEKYLNKRDSTLHKKTAPAHGLYLEKIEY